MTVRDFSDTYRWSNKNFIGIRIGNARLEETFIWDAVFMEGAKDYLVKAFGDCEIQQIVPGGHLFMDIHGITIKLSEEYGRSANETQQNKETMQREQNHHTDGQDR